MLFRKIEEWVAYLPIYYLMFSDSFSPITDFERKKVNKLT